MRFKGTAEELRALMLGPQKQDTMKELVEMLANLEPYQLATYPGLGLLREHLYSLAEQIARGTPQESTK